MAKGFTGKGTYNRLGGGVRANFGTRKNFPLLIIYEERGQIRWRSSGCG